MIQRLLLPRICGYAGRRKGKSPYEFLRNNRKLKIMRLPMGIDGNINKAVLFCSISHMILCIHICKAMSRFLLMDHKGSAYIQIHFH